jgi:hypothetical protein
MQQNQKRKTMLKVLPIGIYTTQIEAQIINTVQLQTIQSIEELDILKTYLKKRRMMRTMITNNYSK